MAACGQLHTPGRFTPWENVPRTHWIGDWVSPRAGLDAAEKKKSHAPVRNRTPAVQPVDQRYTDRLYGKAKYD
jgi:hypothetical protein